MSAILKSFFLRVRGQTQCDGCDVGVVAFACQGASEPLSLQPEEVSPEAFSALLSTPTPSLAASFLTVLSHDDGPLRTRLRPPDVETMRLLLLRVQSGIG